MKTTKTFVKAVNADLARYNVHYSSLWKVAEMQNLITEKKKTKTYAAVVFVLARIDSEPEYWIYYNFDSSMGNNVRFTRRNTAKEADEEFANTFA